ncbi:MAG: DUF4038 domain-containing protein [Spirochaetaceae bacterium]|nr:MAG: DUF4038 domain-containing protein [Spirochaetaceae bacterium]
MPKKISVSPNGDRFIDENGRPFFYLGDTVWSVFTHTTEEEWVEYLEYRAAQGYNVVQINILPQHDASGPGLGQKPFAVKTDGTYDFSRFDEPYFARVDRMLEAAVSRGFVPALVVLWCDYVPETWLSAIKTGHVMPRENVEPYVEYISRRFARFNPMYLVAGDTSDADLSNPASWWYYETALKTIKKHDPSALTTVHIWGPRSLKYDLPSSFLDSELIDFFMYQSGHGFEWWSNPYELPRFFDAAKKSKPIVNGEPCYEGIGHSHGRHSAHSVRRAVWMSLLSGASAGVTYGAHGIWSWHHAISDFANWGPNHFKTPFDWRTALRFPGAWDVAYARRLFDTYGLFDLSPVDEVKIETDEIRMAACENAFAIYMSYPSHVSIARDLTGYDCTVIDLSNTTRVHSAAMQYVSGETRIGMPEFNSDALIIGVR